MDWNEWWWDTWKLLLSPVWSCFTANLVLPFLLLHIPSLSLSLCLSHSLSPQMNLSPSSEEAALGYVRLSVCILFIVIAWQHRLVIVVMHSSCSVTNVQFSVCAPTRKHAWFLFAAEHAADEMCLWDAAETDFCVTVQHVCWVFSFFFRTALAALLLLDRKWRHEFRLV